MFGPLSKNNTGMAALGAGLPVTMLMSITQHVFISYPKEAQ